MEDWTALQAGAFITGWADVISLIGQFPYSTRCPSAQGEGWGGAHSPTSALSHDVLSAFLLT